MFGNISIFSVSVKMCFCSCCVVLFFFVFVVLFVVVNFQTVLEVQYSLNDKKNVCFN